MEFLGSNLTDSEQREHIVALESVCREVGVPLPQVDSASIHRLKTSMELHLAARRALESIQPREMCIPPEVEKDPLEYVDPWLGEGSGGGGGIFQPGAFSSAPPAIGAALTGADESASSLHKVVTRRSVFGGESGSLAGYKEVSNEALFQMFPGKVEFGAPMKESHFHLQHDQPFLNAGSYGATPRVVMQSRVLWEESEMSDPVRWRKKLLPRRLCLVRNVIARFVHANPADLVLMVNCNTATSTVLKSVPWEVGDYILLLSCDYSTTKLAASYLERRYGVRTLYVDIVLPLQDDEVVQTVESFLTLRHRQGQCMPKLANFCHVTSKTGWIFPAKRLVQVFHRFKIPVMVDGAQVPGHFALDVIDIGAEFYMGTCHKWMYTCQGVAFLVTAPSKQGILQPLAPTTFQGELYGKAFQYAALQDYSSFLAVLQSFEFVDRVCGGWAKIWKYNRELARRAATELETMWNLRSEGLGCIQMQQMRPENVDDPTKEFNCMPIIPIPHARSQSANYTDADATRLMGYLLTYHHITAFVLVEKFRLSGGEGNILPLMCVRLTAQIYVNIDEVRRFGKAVLEHQGSPSAFDAKATSGDTSEGIAGMVA